MNGGVRASTRDGLPSRTAEALARSQASNCLRPRDPVRMGFNVERLVVVPPAQLPYWSGAPPDTNEAGVVL